MKKLLLTLTISLLTTHIYANVHYCPGTIVTGAKHQALQYVVENFVAENHCVIGHNCLLNFDHVKYSIAWAEPCLASVAKGNDPKGSTFVCQAGQCYPLGFSKPVAGYQE